MKKDGGMEEGKNIQVFYIETNICLHKTYVSPGNYLLQEKLSNK